jgi:hypothetical protein
MPFRTSPPWPPPSSDSVVRTRTDEYDRQITETAERRRNADRRVVRWVDSSTVTGADPAEGLYPDNNGHNRMTDSLFGGIQRATSADWGDGFRRRRYPVHRHSGRPDRPGVIASGAGASFHDVRFTDMDGDGRDGYLKADCGQHYSGSVGPNCRSGAARVSCLSVPRG